MKMHLVVLIPVFNDWESAGVLLAQLDQQVSRPDLDLRIVLLDDASTTPCPAGFLADQPSLTDRVAILALRRNLGHQRAIAIGLSYIQENLPADAVVVMDGDGEDSPTDVPRLLEEYQRHSASKVVFAGRAKRSESLPFRIGYCAFRILHFILTGHPVKVGNFSVIPRPILNRLVVVSELWNHYAAAVFRSRVPYTILPTRRGMRIAGQSQMNWTSLVVHGLSAIAVFSEIIGVRLLFAMCMLTSLLLAALILVVGIRLGTSLSIPGWATYTTGFLVAMFLQVTLSVIIFTFVILGNRNELSFLPIRDYRYFVASFGTVGGSAIRLGQATGIGWYDQPAQGPEQIPLPQRAATGEGENAHS